MTEKTSSVSIILIDPKYPHNIGAAIRAASCFGVERVTWTGTRAKKEIEAANRIPREERMKGYREVELAWAEKPLSNNGLPVVAIELVKNAVPLPLYSHPKSCIYVFGPEDGSIPKSILRLCWHFVSIPSYHCLNLSAAVYVTLYDRVYKRWQYEEEPLPELIETRGDIRFLVED